MSTSNRRASLTDVKFGPCECSPAEESWALVSSPTDDDPKATYECRTCGEVHEL